MALHLAEASDDTRLVVTRDLGQMIALGAPSRPVRRVDVRKVAAQRVDALGECLRRVHSSAPIRRVIEQEARALQRSR